MPITVEKIQTSADDASSNASKVAYMAESGLSPTVNSIGLDVSLTSMDLKLSVRSDEAVANLQEKLKERGLDAQVTSEASGTEAKTFIMRNIDPTTAMPATLCAMGKLGDAPGGISPSVADQIMEMELAVTRTPPSERGLVKISTLEARDRFADKVRPFYYSNAEIKYELSPVTYLQEYRDPANTGNELFTRMGLRSSAAVEPVMNALQKAGIKAGITHIDNDGITHANVHAAAETISTALKDKGLMLASIDKEIALAAQNNRIAAAKKQADIQQAIYKTATPL